MQKTILVEEIVLQKRENLRKVYKNALEIVTFSLKDIVSKNN